MVIEYYADQYGEAWRFWNHSEGGYHPSVRHMAGRRAYLQARGRGIEPRSTGSKVQSHDQ